MPTDHADRASYPSELHAELAHVPNSQACCQQTAATMLLRWHLNSPLTRSGGNVQVECTNRTTAAQLAHLLGTTPNPATPSLLTVPTVRWQAAIRRTGLLDHTGRPRKGLPPAVVARILGARTCDPATAWRAAIIADGATVDGARTKRTTLSVHCPDLTVALVLVRAARNMHVLATLPNGERQAQAMQTGSSVPITVHGHSIEQLLDQIGAPQSATSLGPLPTPPTRLRQPEPGELDTSNRHRAASAARRQTEQVRAALEAASEVVSPADRAAGQLRLEHPDASLTELGQHAEPPVSKDVIAGRLRRLLAHANQHGATAS